MILISALTAVFFFGGWQGPFQGWPGLGATFLGQPSFLWLFMKVFALVFLFLWFRATFPRYRYDQIMRLGWKALIPATLVWIGVEMLLSVYHIGPWSRPWFH
jgi:NADH-quinone oxidoreductase subunit H